MVVLVCTGCAVCVTVIVAVVITVAVATYNIEGAVIWIRSLSSTPRRFRP